VVTLIQISFEGKSSLSLAVVEPERQSLSIVVLGDFNPAIFHPLWFSANGLVPEEETNDADEFIIQKQIAIFSIGKIQLQVDESRLGLTTVESPQGPILRDLALGTLSILEHTPLKAIGLNLDMAFAIETEHAWHAFGDRLVPKNDWAQILEKPGMQQVVVEGMRSDCNADRVHIRVQPSSHCRVLVAVNQHYQLETAERVDVRERHREAIRVLRDDWANFTAFARNAAAKLLQSSSATENLEGRA
jgi:hypothetical protein